MSVRRSRPREVRRGTTGSSRRIRSSRLRSGRPCARLQGTLLAMGEITLAVVPSATPGDADAFVLDGLCIALTKMLDMPVHGMACRSYQDLANELEMGRVDYAWMSPTLMLLTAEHIQLRPLLSAVRGDLTTYRSAL